MSLIQPFRAYRPKAEIAARMASVPYDVVNTAEARQLAEGNPYSFLHVCRPEIDLPEGIDEHTDRVYATGAANLKKFIADGILAREAEDSLYVYQQRLGEHVQAGVVALCSVREYEHNRIKKHELTRRDKEDDRTRHVCEQNANAEPVFLTYRAQAEIDGMVDVVRASAPLYDFTLADGVAHTIWRIADRAMIGRLIESFGGIKALYIADGHHRTASAVRYGQGCRRRNPERNPERNPQSTGLEPYEFFMAVMFPHNQLKIFDYNRIVRDLNGLTLDELLAKIGEKFEVGFAETRQPSRAASFGMYLQGKWYALKARAGSYPAEDPIKRLDVSILQENLLSPVLGIHDPRTDKRIDFVGGIRGMDELERRVKEGYAVAFSLYPTSLDQLIDVADAGEIMPPKSTWFEPKLRSGLLVRMYE